MFYLNRKTTEEIQAGARYSQSGEYVPITLLVSERAGEGSREKETVAVSQVVRRLSENDGK